MAVREVRRGGEARMVMMHGSKGPVLSKLTPRVIVMRLPDCKVEAPPPAILNSLVACCSAQAGASRVTGRERGGQSSEKERSDASSGRVT